MTEPLIFVGLIVVAVVVVATLLKRRSQGGRGTKQLHTMERDRTVGYFQDLSGRGPASGVQEEDSVGRWGAGERSDDR